MYKSKLQELCHQEAWGLPEYSTSRDGPDHGPRFKSTVTVNGVTFETPDECRSSKEAQNKAAKLAFDHFTAPPKPLQCDASISSSTGYSTSIMEFDIGSSSRVTLQPTIQGTLQTTPVDETPFGVKTNRNSPGYSTTSINFDTRPSAGVTLQPTIQKMIQIPLVNETPLGGKDDENSAGYSISSKNFDIRPSTRVTLQPSIQNMVQSPTVNETLLGVKGDEKSAGYSTSSKNFDIRPSTRVTLQPTIQKRVRTTVNETPLGVKDDKSAGYSTSSKNFDIRPSTRVTLQPTIQKTVQTPTVNETPLGVKDDKSAGFSISSKNFDIRPSTRVTLQPTIQKMVQTPTVNETPLGVKDDKSAGYSTSSKNFDIRPSTRVTSQPTIQKMVQTPTVNETPLGVKDDESAVVQHYYKSRLQNYAQKRNLGFPVYSCERQGPPHASRFKSTVMIDGQTYESLEIFPTVREAEQAAAKVACESLSNSEVQEDDSNVYKNLLQELAQKKGLLLPVYETAASGPPHTPIFVSTVEIGGQLFQGQEAKSKKQAEKNVAKVAYIGLQERRESGPPTILSSHSQIKEALNATSSILQSIINTGDSQQTVKPKASLTIHEQQNEEDKGGNQEKFSPKSTNVTADADTHHAPDLPPGADNNAKRHRCNRQLTCSSSSDFVYAHLRDPFPSTSSSPEDGDCSATSVMDSTVNSPARTSNLPCNKVSVYPRKPNMTFPDGTTVLPFSDDKWVAVRMDSNQNQ